MPGFGVRLRRERADEVGAVRRSLARTSSPWSSVKVEIDPIDGWFWVMRRRYATAVLHAVTGRLVVETDRWRERGDPEARSARETVYDTLRTDVDAVTGVFAAHQVRQGFWRFESIEAVVAMAFGWGEREQRMGVERAAAAVAAGMSAEEAMAFGDVDLGRLWALAALRTWGARGASGEQVMPA